MRMEQGKDRKETKELGSYLSDVLFQALAYYGSHSSSMFMRKYCKCIDDWFRIES